MAKDSNVSSNAIVDTDEGKNCGVSIDTTKPKSALTITGDAGLSDIPIHNTPCARAMLNASTTSVL